MQVLFRSKAKFGRFVLSSIPIVFVLLPLGGCSYMPWHKETETEYVEAQCTTKSMVGDESGVKLAINAQYEKLRSLQVSLDAGTYSRLSQKLDGYNVEWERLNSDTQLACHDWALCEFRSRPNIGKCKEERTNMEFRQDTAREFFARLKGFSIDDGVVQIVQAVGDSLSKNLSGRKVSFDITVRNPTSKVAQVTEIHFTFRGGEGSPLAGVTEVSGVYAIDVAKNDIKASGDNQPHHEAYSWFPSNCGGPFHVKAPIAQTIKPNDVDRFQVDIDFPVSDCLAKAPVSSVNLNLTVNGVSDIAQALIPVSVTGAQ